MPESTNDPVNHPAHYVQNGMEAIDVISAFMPQCDPKIGWLWGNSMKYLLRLGRKGELLEDAGKARWYLDRLIHEAAMPERTQDAFGGDDGA